MAVRIRIFTVLRVWSKIQFTVLIAAAFYAVGFMSGRSKNVEIDVITRWFNKSTENVIFGEKLIDVNGTTNEEERCARKFELKYRELCRRTMLGYVLSL